MQSVSRRHLLAATGGAVLATSLIAQVASAQADRPRRSPWDLAFDISMDPSAAMPTAAGPFYVSGTVMAAGSAAGTPSAGTARVWGYVFDPSRPGPAGSVATATIELTGRGQIVLGGSLVAGRVAIIAGTGEFRGANGQAEYVDLGGGAARVILDYTTPYEGT